MCNTVSACCVDNHCLHRERIDILKTYAGQEVVLNI